MIRPEDADRLGNLPLALCVTPANMLLDINLIDSGGGGKRPLHLRFPPADGYRRAGDVQFRLPGVRSRPAAGHPRRRNTSGAADGTKPGLWVGWHPQQRWRTVPRKPFWAYTA
jgi:hypothetical protein